MQFLLDRPPAIQGTSMDVGQIRRLILSVFDDACLVHCWPVPDQVEQITVDESFALLRKDGGNKWFLASIHEVSGHTEFRQLGEFSSARNAVRRRVVLMATARIEAAIGQAEACHG